jgi:hypothetical protein
MFISWHLARILAVGVFGLVANGCGSPDSTAPVMVDTKHTHYHVHAADASHEHSHEDGSALGGHVHTHAHEHAEE